MATKNNTYRNIPKAIGITLLSLLLMSTLLDAQTYSKQRIELPEIAIVNLLNGIRSDNNGVKKSCVYFAGKYKVLEVSQDLVEQIENSNDEELCQMIVWSLYQIGNDSCCEELQRVMKQHPLEKLKDFCNYLHKIKEYQTAVAKN